MDAHRCCLLPDAHLCVHELLPGRQQLCQAVAEPHRNYQKLFDSLANACNKPFLLLHGAESHLLLPQREMQSLKMFWIDHLLIFARMGVHAFPRRDASLLTFTF